MFPLHDSELRETDMVTNTIDTGNAKPVETSPRWFPYVLQQVLEQKLTSLLNKGCIEPSSSPALVLVRKKNGALIVCVVYRGVGYRGVNMNMIPDQYPIPRINELINIIGREKPKVFTSLDLMKCSHQGKMAKDS